MVQANVAIGVDDADSEAMKGFFDGLALVNQTAKEADGFIAMLGENGGGGAGELPDDWYLNVSVWRDEKALMKFVYNGEHRAYLKRKHEWYGGDHCVFARAHTTYHHSLSTCVDVVLVTMECALMTPAYCMYELVLLSRFKPWNEKEMKLERQCLFWWPSSAPIPEAREALRRMRHLTDHGPSPTAFTFQHVFPKQSSSHHHPTS